MLYSCRSEGCRQEDREGSLNVEARQPRVDGRVGQLVLVLDAECSSEGKSCEGRVGMVGTGSVVARVAGCARCDVLGGLRGQ